MRDEDRIRVIHMVDAAESAMHFLSGRNRDDLDRDQMLLFAVVRAIELIGEAANKISLETRAATTQVPWAAIVSMRNRLIHGYADIDRAVLWNTATQEVPTLLPLLRALVATST